MLTIAPRINAYSVDPVQVSLRHMNKTEFSKNFGNKKSHLTFSSLYFIIASNPLRRNINFDQSEHISNVCYGIKQPLA